MSYIGPTGLWERASHIRPVRKPTRWVTLLLRQIQPVPYVNAMSKPKLKRRVTRRLPVLPNGSYACVFSAPRRPVSRGNILADSAGLTLEACPGVAAAYGVVALDLPDGAPSPEERRPIDYIQRNDDWLTAEGGFLVGAVGIAILQVIDPVAEAGAPDILDWLQVQKTYNAEISRLEQNLRDLYEGSSSLDIDPEIYQEEVFPALVEAIDRRHKDHFAWIRRFAHGVRPARLDRLQDVYYGITNSSDILVSVGSISITSTVLKRAFNWVAGWRN